ncbi:MAG: MFS transporter [Nakamurella sp.]
MASRSSTRTAATASGAPSAATTAPQQPVRRVVVFTTIALALMMMSVDGTIVSTALHTLQTNLNTSINWAGWTITAYALGFVLMLPLSGKLSDRYGRRRVFLASVVVFTAASLACGLAPNIGTLIALRAVQAAGGAGFTPSATGIIVDHFGTARDRYVGLFGSIFPVGTMIGPIFGGIFVTYASWRDVFLVNVPVGVAVMMLALRFIPRDLSPTEMRGRYDATHHTGPTGESVPTAGRPAFGIPGMVLLGIGLLSGMLAASYLAHGHSTITSPIFVTLVAVSLVGFVAFFLHTSRSTRPFIAPRLIYGRGFGAVNAINSICSGLTQGVVSLVPLYAASRYGIDPLRSGTLLIAEGIAAMVLSTAVAFALRRTGYRIPIYVGISIIACGVALLAVYPPTGITPYLWLAMATFLVGAGFGSINPASRNAGLQLAPESAATLAAVRSGGMQVGAIITVSVATALLAASTDPGLAQAWFYAAAACVFVLSLTLVRWVPEHHGSW